jgi:uncharacterized protein YprB with RNaseH-like and TPR domain
MPSKAAPKRSSEDITSEPLVKHLPVGISEGSLIDFETTGLDPRTSDVVTLGYIVGNTMHILQRRDTGPSFDKRVKEVLESLPEPIFAYNSPFEERFTRDKYGLARRFGDIMAPWKRRADEEGLKWPKLEELLPDPETYFGDKITGGAQVPGIWADYLATRNVDLLERIVRHNEIDLLRELMLLVRYGFD